MSLYKLGDVLGYQDVNEILKLWESTTAPTGAEIGEIYLDTSSSPPKLRRFDGSNWEMVSVGSFKEDPANGQLISNATHGPVLLFDGGDTRMTIHDGSGNFNIKCNVDENNVVGAKSDGAARISMYDTGIIQLAVSEAISGSQFTIANRLQIQNSGVYLNMKAVPTATDAVHFQYGSIDLPAGHIPITVTFPESYSSIPYVVTAETTAVTVIHAVTTRTLTEFEITTHPTVSGSACWLAIGLR
jgi:hypothetical protein